MSFQFLTPDSKHNFRTTSHWSLMLFKHNTMEFLRRFEIVHETWIYPCTLKAKKQSKKSTGKVTTTGFVWLDRSTNCRKNDLAQWRVLVLFYQATHRLTPYTIATAKWFRTVKRVFSSFGSTWQLFVSKLKKFTRRAEIWFEWEGPLYHRALLCRLPENIVFFFTAKWN